MASGILSALVGSFGFRTSFEVTFEKILPPVPLPIGGLTISLPPIPLPTIVPVKRSFFEAQISVEMPQPGSANKFEVTIIGLGNDIYSLLDPNNTVVHVTLGYADADSKEVIAGVLTEKHLGKAPDGCFYQATLVGRDFVFDQLQYPRQKMADFTSDKNQTIGQIAKKICQLANVPEQIKVDGPPLDSLHFAFSDKDTPLGALQALARRGNVALQVKDGKVWMGNPSDLGTDHPKPISDGTVSKPVTTRGGTPSASSSDGQDFDMAGDPTIRPNDTVIFGTDKFRIESVTHKLLSNGGYRCVGRALSADAPVGDQKAGGRPTAAQVGQAILDKLSTRERTRPAVSVGEVSDYTEGKHTTTLSVGTNPDPAMANPTVQAPMKKDTGKLPDKPIASPFAFGSCGLVVPVYSKMRTLLVHGWNDPNDAVVDGFLWTSDMTPPPNQQGDWWLCLPTQLDADNLPTGPTSDDLITKDGQRLISVKGMKITVGSSLLNQVGSRPSPGTDESLTITTDQGAKIVLSGGQIRVTDGSVTLTVGQGKVSIG
jgi:hypothetical protein